MSSQPENNRMLLSLQARGFLTGAIKRLQVVHDGNSCTRHRRRCRFGD